uniref:non-specific serine/threonine protein kinase n=1 Tax=Anopheles melas TaxID=34690 RepID=A0A182U745_9DIPT
MESDLSTCLRQLKTCLDTQQIPQARSIIDRITQLIVEKAEESQAETDFNLECMLTSANGLVAFLNKSFSSAKHFGKVIESTFELFRKTIEKHSPLMGKRMVAIVPIALRYIQSSSVPARSRELAALVLQDSIAYGCLQNETYAQLDQLPAELLLVFHQAKLPNRFQQNLYELLGQLAQNFPASIPEPDRVRDIFLNAAEKQLLEENYPSLVSLAGAVRGLDLFLVHFAPSENDRELRQRLYLLVKKLSIWEESRSERAVFRNALHVVGNHAPLFSWQLYADHVHWQTVLAGRWIKLSSQEDRDAGLKALYAFHGEIARVLSTPELAAERGREYPPKVDVLNQYVNYYRKLLSSATVDHLEIRIAIRGFGIMAGPCQQLAGASSISLNELLTIVLQRIEGICERSASSTADMLVYLPDFIQALSEILTHVQQLSTVQLVSVQTMTVALVRDFYHISTAHHELIVRSVVSMLENIGKLGGTTRHQLLDSVLLQGIVWSCTHAMPFPAALPVPSSNVAAGDTTPKTDWKRDLVTYKNYLPLWQGLLEKAQSAHNSSLLPALYRALMNTLFVIVEKLDLSTRKRTFQDDDGQQQELFFSDPNIDLLPTKPKDYHIFLNLVELYRDMLHGPQTPVAVRELFADWIRPYFERFVRQSLNRPLVSGFVKLIEMGLATAERIGYFRQQEAPAEDFRTTQILLAFYLEQTIQRALYAIGELQLACLRFVLNAPIRLLVDFIEDKTRKQPLMVDVFRTAFRLGRSLLSIARAALNSLQRIVRFRYPPLRREIRERLLRQVLPLLEPFLRTRDSTQPPAQSLRLAKFKRHRTANVPAVKIERIKQQHRIEQSVDTSELVTFQLRILNFFADLQPNECCWLVVDELELERVHARENRGSSSSLTRWDADSGRSLELRLLCESGTRPCIKLDSIVGRVCELAVECSDRATKLAACELLHTIVLYLLGISYQDQLAGLWTQVCHHLLQLSCDTDLAVCQMFEPLLFQIIHFVTQPSKLGQQGTRTLLDCLLDATSNVQHSSTIRDLSVRCLREFLQWTNRQCGGTHLSNDRRKIKCTLLEQLKTHALELNASHRYGSALAFNNLFRLLLQEDFHIVRYSFELMHSYAIGLIVTEQEQIGLSSEANGGSHGAIVEQYLLALDHLGKLFEQRKALFNGCSSDDSARSGRRQLIPTELGGGEMEHLVRWLFRQCAARQRLYRRKCMELFARLSKTVRDVATAEQFLAKQFTQEQIVSICLQADSLQGIERASTLESLRNEQTNPPIMNISLWLEYFLATVDMYCWLRREKLVVDELLQTLLSRILPAVRYFLRSVVNFTVQEIMSNIEPVESFQQRSYEQRMTADKFVRFDALKSAVVVQVVDILSEDMLQPNIRHGEHFLVCFGAAVYELFLQNPSNCLPTLFKALKPENFSYIVRFLCNLMDYSYRKQATNTDSLKCLVEMLLAGGWSPLFECSRLQSNQFGACDVQLIELMSSVAMICPFPLNEIHHRVGPTYGRWLTELIGSTRSELSIELKAKAIVLLPTLLGPNGAPEAESHWAEVENALEALQTKHFPLRSAEFPPNSPERIGYLNCLERLLDALVISRSPLLLKAIIQMTAPDGDGHIAEAELRTAIERFFADQPHEMQCKRLLELWELFANHDYAPVVRETILRRYLCTALWHCRYDSIVQFYTCIIRALSHNTMVEINGRTGWALEHALIDRAASYRLVEHYAALLPKQILTGDNCPVAQELYGSAHDTLGAPVRGQRLIGDFSKRAHGVRRVALSTNDRTVAELFRKYQCAAYRALVALISNTNEDARMYSVLLFRESREKGEFLWRHLIDCSNEELYLEGTQEQEQLSRTFEKRVAIRREGGAGGDPAQRKPALKDPGLSVVMESSLSQQVFRFDMSHSVVLSAREVARKDAAELAKRQQGTLSNVSLERTKINRHEIMATVCGCIRHMAATKVPLDSVVHFLVGSLADPGQQKNVRLFLAKVIDNCRNELQPHAALLIGPLMQLIVDGYIFRGLNPLVTDLIALVLEWNASGEARRSLREGATGEIASLASVLLRFIMKHACPQQSARKMAVLRLNLELIQEVIVQWHEALTVPAELLFEMVSHRQPTEDRSQLQLIAGLQLGTIVLLYGRGKLVPWMESTKQDYLRAVLRCLNLPDSTSFKSAALLLGHSLAHLYPDGFPEPEQQTGEPETFHTECIAKLTSIQREYDRKFAEVLYETAKGFPSIADPFLSVLSYRFPSASGGEKRLYLELLLGGRLEKFNDELYRELASMELTLLLQDGELQLPTLHLLNRSLSLVRELEHLQQLVEPIGRVATEPSTPNEARAVAFEILIYIHEHRSAELSEECRTSVWRNLIRGLCGSHETEVGSSSIRGRILEYLTDSGKLPSDVKERFLFVLAQLYDPTVEAEFLGNAVALLLDPAIRCRESKDRLFLHEYLNADVKFCEYTIETAARQRHTMTLLTPMFAETSQQLQLQSFITGRGSQMEQLIRATQLGGLDSAAQKQLPFEPTQDPGRLSKGNETFAMPTQQHTLLFESSALQLNRRSQRTGSSTETAKQQDRSFERLRKRILKDSATNRQQQTAWAVSRHYASQRQRTEQRRDSTSKVTLYRRYRLADYPDLQINLLAFLLPLQALCSRDTTCARQAFVAIFNGLVECLLAGDSEGRTSRMVGDEWDRFVGRLDEALNPILESTKACDPNLFGGLIELTLGKASGKFTLPPRTIASVAGTCNMLPMGALYLEAKLADGAEFDDEPVRTAGSVSSEADHWLQLSTLYHALHEHSVMVGIFGEKLDSDPQLREAIELEALGRYGQAHRAYCELVMRVSRARVDERNFCYKSAFNCLLQLGQWDVLLDEIGNQVTNHEELWCDEWNQENLLPHYVHGNALLVLAGDEGGREFYRLLEQWLHMPQRERYIRQEFGEQLTALYLSAQDMVRARLFGEQTKRQFLDEWHCSGVLSELVRTECLLSVRKVIELVAYSELLERSTKELEQAAGGLIVSWNNAQPAVTDSLLTWDTLLAYRRFLLEQLETKCTREEEREKSDSLTNVTQLSKLLFELELNLLDVAFEQDNVKFAGKIIARLRAFEACLREPQVDQVLRRKIARIRYDRVRVVEASAANLTPALLRGFKQLVKLNSQLVPLEHEAGIRGVKQRAWTEFFHHSETVRTMLKTSSDIIEQKDSSMLVELMQTAMNTSSKHLTEEPLSMGDRLRKFSMQCLQCGIDVLLDEGPSSSRERSSSANDSSMEQLADAHLRLARYCYDELDPARTAAEELPVERLLLTSLLPAMKYGSREARHLFPVLLQLRNLQNDVLGKEFHENACSVPSWNFLPWIPQLLSYMQIATPDRPLAPSGVEHFLDEVLMRLVQEYPMALYFPARLLLGELLQPDASVRPFVNQFRAALSFPMLDRFVAELYRVVMPETRLSNMIAELKRHLASVTDQPSYHTFIERLVPDVFPLDTNDLWRYGQAYRAALPLVERFRTLQSLHPVDDRGTILAKLQELETNLESLRPRLKTTRLQLEDLSPWLADYHSSGQRGSTTQLVEIPGQYGFDRGAPNPTQHVTIVKVLPDVVVYGTLRLPIQLTFRGSDGNEYRFLAKFGEDLRQDQRIQQLQREITHRLRWDQRCREQQLQLRTYDVVPILPNFGLFGWLEGTVAMSEIAKQAAPRYNPGDRGQAHVHHEFGRFLMSVSKQLDPSANDSFNLSSYNAPALYGMAAAFCMPDRLQSKFVELAQTIRGNTLKRALYDMAATPEAYYRLRMNFAKSLATMNVTCWVLGIGDRHLSNIVLERATGMLVGVDFGIAFGAGTRDLPIPELVPFRLTPQFVGVMEPMRLAGVLQKCHLYTLQCLRNCRTLLRACLEVFVREPTVDWLRAARQRMVEQPSESGRAEERRSDREWNPQVRVDTVLRKLNGANPKQLLTDELRFGVVAQQRDFLVGYLALVDAAAPACTEKVGRRATGTISTELQTEMLLEMAIDSRLLGITYSGWYPWF